MPPVVLCILDGWGLSKDKVSNAPLLAKTPNYDHLWQTCPKTKLLTHGLDVGLPKGQMGNSEVGHMNIGAGRIISMDLGQIDLEIEDENFFENKILLKHIQDIKKNNLFPINHEQKNPRNETSHKIEIISKTLLAKINKKKFSKVNSAHHQAIKDIGKLINKI